MQIKASGDRAIRQQVNHERRCHRKSKHSIPMIYVVSSDWMNLDSMDLTPCLDLQHCVVLLVLLGSTVYLQSAGRSHPLGSEHSLSNFDQQRCRFFAGITYNPTPTQLLPATEPHK